MTKLNNIFLNIESKSQLAKLFATENLNVEFNNVSTASFNLETRTVTLPIFKSPNIDVYDMLTAHECAHALYTPLMSSKKFEDISFRSYVNVLEDCRIDKKIQKKYPGIVKNYLNGFDILMKKDFFGLKKRNVNVDTDLAFIDKVNIYYKSTKRHQFKFNDVEKKWLNRIDNLKTFKEVVALAEELIKWQKKENDKLKSLPNFDDLKITVLYNLNGKNPKNGMPVTANVAANGLPDDKNNNKGDDKSKVVCENAGGGHCKILDINGLTSVTNNHYEEERSKLVDKSVKYRYCTLPKVDFKASLVSYEKFLKDMRQNAVTQCAKKYNPDFYHLHTNYYNWLKNEFNKFKRDSQKTVMYLVKEFEMKKAANSYQRALTDKTGIIDPLKLKNYKFDEDIFKKLTIIPNSKNHGMIMLLDWSGSMSQHIYSTVLQLQNLIWFCEKVSIPFEVYIFADRDKESSKKDDKDIRLSFNFKEGDLRGENFKIVNIASSKMKKSLLNEAMFHLYFLGRNYDPNRELPIQTSDFFPPEEYALTSTPLNEAVIAMDTIVPLFKQKHKIEKLTFITLSDGAANTNIFYTSYTKKNPEDTLSDYGSVLVVKDGKRKYVSVDKSSKHFTGMLLNILKNKHKITTVGFYLLSKFNERNLTHLSTDNKGFLDYQKTESLRRAFLKDRTVTIPVTGYDSFFLVNTKNMRIENDLKLDEMSLKKSFMKGMQNRIYSRVLLNKFIERVA